MPGGLSGPFTSWHANGALASHGTYLDEGSRSIPDGVWAFWYPSGARKSLGYTRALSPRFELDATLALALDVITVTGRRRDLDGTADLRFYRAVPAAQVGVAYALSPMIYAVVAARVDGLPAQDEVRAVSYCRDASGPFLACTTPQVETWRIGGMSFGATLGLRLVLR